MKILVNLVQLAIIIAIVYPILSFWESDRIEKFCQTVESGISRQSLLNQADKAWMNLVKNSGHNGKWTINIVSYLPYNKQQCIIKGKGNKVRDAWIEADK